MFGALVAEAAFVYGNALSVLFWPNGRRFKVGRLGTVAWVGAGLKVGRLGYALGVG